MKSVLGKISKIGILIERDGFLGGLKNIGERVSRVMRMILKWPKGDIVFVSGLTGAVALYRNDYVAEELQEQGFKTGVLFVSDPFLLLKLRRFRIIVLSRVNWSKVGLKIVEQAKRLGQEIIYDTDDLLFDEELFRKSDMYKNFTALEKEEYIEISGKMFLQNDKVKAVTMPTVFLANKLSVFKKPVFVVKNKLSKREQGWAREARKFYLEKLNKEESKKEIRLGYFSGSISHNRDFATIIPVLEFILKRYKNVKLYLVGYLDVKDAFYRKFKEQIVVLPFVPRKDHYQNIARVDVNLIPLEDNDFCRAKSEIKFIEAGVIGIPSIAVRNETFSSVIENGDNGLLADSVDEWIEKIELLINNTELRNDIGERARQTVLKKYLTTSKGNVEYYNFIKKLLKQK